MFDIASCTHQITLHIKHRQGDTNSLNSSIFGTAVCRHFYYIERAERWIGQSGKVGTERAGKDFNKNSTRPEVHREEVTSK